MIQFLQRKRRFSARLIPEFFFLKMGDTKYAYEENKIETYSLQLIECVSNEKAHCVLFPTSNS
jgi:hypothetical protein